jgi:tetratricopeptide (TPR) repeat protein
MFRRSLCVFLGLVLLVLAVTLGYALLGLAGPGAHLDSAREDAAAGRHARAIRTLDIVERSLDPRSSGASIQELLRLRADCFLATANYPPALRDLERLRQLRPDDLDLFRDQIRWTIVAGQPEAALELAQTFLVDNPDDAAVLELAGEASKTIYQARLRDLLNDVGAQLDPVHAEQAFRAIRSWVYRSRRDPVAELAIERFSAILREVRPEMAASGRYELELREIRDLIFRTIDYFNRALEGEGTPVAAYTGIAYALRQAGRHDDLQYLAEIYLHRFDHVYATIAAVDLAELHLAQDREEAVIEVRERFLPRDAWRERVEAGRLDSTVSRLLLAEARARGRLGDDAGLAALLEEAEAMHADPRLDLEPELLWIRAIVADRQGRAADAMRDLGSYDAALAQLPQSPEVVERRIAVMNVRLRIAKERSWSPDFFRNAYRTLARLDPNDPRPSLEQTRFRIEQDDPDGALLELRTARRVAAHDEEVLHLEARGIDAQLEKVGRGAARQVARCLELGLEVPLDVPDVQLMPIAEEALRSGHPEIALACARRAAERYSWARWPRHLIVRAAFELDDPETARRAAEAILAYHPGEVQALVELREARRALGRPTDDLVYDLLLAGRQDPQTARALLESALERGERTLAGHLAATVDRRYRDDPDALLAAAGIQEASGELRLARDTLLRAGELAVKQDRHTFVEAFDRYVLLTAETVTDAAEVRMVVERAIGLHRDDPARLTRLATELHARGQAPYAYLVLTPVLEDPRHAAQRSGAQYLLGGRIALELGLLDAAERHFLAALTFDDGQAAGRLITLLQLQRGQTGEAEESFWDETATDLSSAALFARFGDRARAAAWIRLALAGSPADTGALALAAVVTPNDRQPAPFRALAEADPEALVEALAFVDAEGFERGAIDLCQRLVAASGRNPVARILLARARVRAGQLEEGLALLEAVLVEEPLLISAYEEAIVALERPDAAALPDARIVARLVQPELLQSGLATPRMVAFATRQRANELVARLRSETGSVEELAALWLRSPAGGETSLDQIDVLAAVGRVDLALQLCTAIERHVPAALRRRFATSCFTLAQAWLATRDDEAVAREAAERARRFLEQDGAIGIAAHYLFDRELATGGPLAERREPERLARLAALLDTHLAAVRRGVPGESSMLAATLGRYAELRGRRAAIDLATERLRADPTLIAVWLQRARWMAQEGEREEAILGLRWLHHYVPTHPAVLECIELSAREGVIHDDDLRVVRDQMLDEAQLETPDALLTRGLLMLRRAEYERAVDFLSRGAERGDGAHLFYRGLALLPLGRTEETRELLERCAAEYSDSTLTGAAEHFAKQLAR